MMKNITQSKLWSFLAGAGSAMVMVLAFFIPSIQDQWDRYQSRKIINQYETLGKEFYEEGQYEMAEQAYSKAFELSDSKRLDLEVSRLKSKINRINMNSQWGAPPPDDLEEVDFQYVLHLLKGKENQPEKANTLNSYGLFLVSKDKLPEAEKAFTEAVLLDSTNASSYINLGNLHDQKKQKNKALYFYKKALQLDSKNGLIHYNLGLLYLDMRQKKQAALEFEEAIIIDSTDTASKDQLKQLKDEAPGI